MKDTDVIRVARFPLAILVVLIHSFIPVNGVKLSGGVDYWHCLSGCDVYTIVGVSFSTVLARGAVPFFFFMSGYLFFLSFDKWNWLQWVNKIKRRGKSLLIPYLSWISVAILIPISIFLLASIIKGTPFFSRALEFISEHGGVYGLFWNDPTKMTTSRSLIGEIINHTFPYLMPMWYVRDLMVLVLLSPILFFYIKKTKIVGLVLLLLAYIIGFDFGIPGFGVTSLFFYSFGGFFSIHKRSFTVAFDYLNIRIFYIVAFVLFVLCVWCGATNTWAGRFFLPLWVMSEIVLLCNLFRYIISNGGGRIGNYCIYLSNSSYFIFAFHGILIGYVISLLMWLFGADFSENVISYNWLNNHTIVGIVVYFLTPVVTVFICLIVYRIVCKLLPRANWIITANITK